MGSANCRPAEPDPGKALQSKSEILSKNHGRESRMRFRRSVSKAKGLLHRQRPCVGAAHIHQTTHPMNNPQMKSPEMQERQPSGRQGPEIIEISDDEDEENDSLSIISVATAPASSDRRLSPKIYDPRQFESRNGAALPSRPPTVYSNVSDDGLDAVQDWEQWQDFFEMDDGFSQMHNPQMQPNLPADSFLTESPQPAGGADNVGMDRSLLRVVCINDTVALFPEICRDHVSELYDSGLGPTADRLVAYILDQLEKGKQYPKAKDKLQSLKRKRAFDEDEEAANMYGSSDRERCSTDYGIITRNILSGEFSTTPMSFIDATLAQTKHHLFPAYRVLELAERTWDPVNPPYNRIKNPRKLNPYYREDAAEQALRSDSTTQELMLALRELQAARRARRNVEAKIQEERQLEVEEEENVRRAQADGTMQECGCCFGDYPLNRMVHCDNEAVLHWFCRGCAKTTAETEIGNSKYELHCMSTDGCLFGFSKDQKDLFLDEKTLIALDRNEQEAVLRMAGIENLASCPFCPFAAEYPPVEETRLFRCQAPDCEKISCRLCKLESHVPKTCEENARDTGFSIRRQIEEAMSAALIRKCNKCGTPFVKEEGCNKMTCTRGGCYNIQCYVCSKSCDYNHFDDRSRGGRPGNCPLFDSVQQRHDQEVQQAEKEALARVRAEHPQYSEEDLKIKVSEGVQKDEAARRANDPRVVNRVALFPGQVVGGRPGVFPHLGPRLGVFLADGAAGELNPNNQGPADVERRFPILPERAAGIYVDPGRPHFVVPVDFGHPIPWAAHPGVPVNFPAQDLDIGMQDLARRQMLRQREMFQAVDDIVRVGARADNLNLQVGHAQNPERGAVEFLDFQRQFLQVPIQEPAANARASPPRIPRRLRGPHR